MVKSTPIKCFSCEKYFKLSLSATWYAKAVAHIPNTWKFAFSSSAAAAVESEKKMNVEGKAIRKDHYQTYLKLIVARRWIVCRVLGTWYCPKIERREKVDENVWPRLHRQDWRHLESFEDCSHISTCCCARWSCVILKRKEHILNSIENWYSLTNYK